MSSRPNFNGFVMKYEVILQVSYPNSVAPTYW